MKMRRFAAFFVLLLAVAQTAWAADPVYVCRLSNGAEVPILADNTLKNVAVSRIDRNGRRSIVYNPKYLGVFNVETRWFWLAHECAHQQLGQVGQTYTKSMESQADCYGIQRLLEDGQMDANGVKDVLSDISQLGSSSPLYPTGPERARHIQACAVQVLGN